MNFRRLSPGEMPTAAEWNALCEAVERVSRLSGDPASGVEVVRTGGGPPSIRVLQQAATLTVTGYDSNDALQFITPVTTADFEQAAFGVAPGAPGVAHIGLYLADPFHGIGSVTNTAQEFGGEKMFLAGAIFGTNLNDFLALTTASPSAAGTGYVAGDTLTLSGGTFAVAATANVTSVDGAGAVTGVSVNRAGDFTTGSGQYTVIPANPVATTGGSGAGCTLSAAWQGQAPGAFVEASPGNQGGNSYGSPPYLAYGDWSLSAPVYAVENAGRTGGTANFWSVSVPQVVGGSAGGLIVKAGGGSVATAYVAGPTGLAGCWGVVDTDNITLRSGKSGTTADGSVWLGGILITKGSLFATKPNVTGSRAGNAALASLLTGLAGLGLLTDSTT